MPAAAVVLVARPGDLSCNGVTVHPSAKAHSLEDVTYPWTQVSTVVD
jgi:hypothetical protein